MIPHAQHLLPPNATAAEQRVASLARRISDIDAPIESAHDPAAAPAAFVPFLAWERSVDLWRPAWPEQQKRSVTAEAIGLHRRKGTRGAIARYCEYVGSRLLDVLTPPGKLFAAPSWTAAEREAWLSSLPQLRVWDQKQRGERGAHLFMPSQTEKLFFFGNRRRPIATDARFRLERRAALYLDGTVTSVDCDGLGAQVDRVRIRGKSKYGAFCGAARRGYLAPSTSGDRVITFRLVERDNRGVMFPVRPGLQVLDVVPDRVLVRGHSKHGMFCGLPGRRRYMRTSDAAARVFFRVSIFDRAKAPPARKTLAFCGRGRFGMPPHTAELKVGIPGRRPRRAFGAYVNGFLAAADRTRWRDTFAAIRAGKRLSDRLQVNSKTLRPYRLGSAVFLGGSYPLGRWTRS